MNVIQKAINFAGKAHRSQNRKGTDIPYITHPFAVGMLLQQAKCSDAVIAAGILHDTLEDTTTTFEELTEQFGDRIANLVQAASEQDKSLPWMERKQHTIDMLKNAYIEEIQVITADKLHNLQSIKDDLEMVGDSVWERFNHGKRDQQWYYTSILKELTPRKKEFKLIHELEKEVKLVFGTLNALNDKEITMLFLCAYGINDDNIHKLKDSNVFEIAKELTDEAERIYRKGEKEIFAKLDDLSSRGIQFQNNSDGPLILAAFCLVIQKKMNWTDQEVYEYFKKNLSVL
jgi:hypothetical protein